MELFVSIDDVLTAAFYDHDAGMTVRRFPKLGHIRLIRSYRQKYYVLNDEGVILLMPDLQDFWYNIDDEEEDDKLYEEYLSEQSRIGNDNQFYEDHHYERAVRPAPVLTNLQDVTDFTVIEHGIILLLDNGYVMFHDNQNNNVDTFDNLRNIRQIGRCCFERDHNAIYCIALDNTLYITNIINGKFHTRQIIHNSTIKQFMSVNYIYRKLGRNHLSTTLMMILEDNGILHYGRYNSASDGIDDLQYLPIEHISQFTVITSHEDKLKLYVVDENGDLYGDRYIYHPINIAPSFQFSYPQEFQDIVLNTRERRRVISLQVREDSRRLVHLDDQWNFCIDNLIFFEGVKLIPDDLVDQHYNNRFKTTKRALSQY